MLHMIQTSMPCRLLARSTHQISLHSLHRPVLRIVILNKKPSLLLETLLDQKERAETKLKEQIKWVRAMLNATSCMMTRLNKMNCSLQTLLRMMVSDMMTRWRRMHTHLPIRRSMKETFNRVPNRLRRQTIRTWLSTKSQVQPQLLSWLSSKKKILQRSWKAKKSLNSYNITHLRCNTTHLRCTKLRKK